MIRLTNTKQVTLQQEYDNLQHYLQGDNPNIFVIKGGNLEYFMKHIDASLYSRIEDKVKKEYKSRDPPKPVVAYKFAEELSKKPEALKAISKLLSRILLSIL